MQILHTGRYAYHPFPVAPSAIRAPINRFKPRELSSDGVRDQIADFVNCAALAQEAGYDGVEIMGSEGYFINEFLAPRTNLRTDEWGGPLENRAALRSKSCARPAPPSGREFIIIFRISGLDLVEGGGTGAEVEWLPRRWRRAGATMLNTGIGWHEARVPTIAGMVPRGAFGWVSARIKAATRLPVIATNRINVPDGAEAHARARRCRPRVDGAAACWPIRSCRARPRRARERDQHLHRLQPGLPRSHLREQTRHLPRESARRLRDRAGASTPRRHRSASRWWARDLPGSPARRRSGERGHRVTLFERESEIGGQFRYAREVRARKNSTTRCATSRGASSSPAWRSSSTRRGCRDARAGRVRRNRDCERRRGAGSRDSRHRASQGHLLSGPAVAAARRPATAWPSSARAASASTSRPTSRIGRGDDYFAEWGIDRTLVDARRACCRQRPVPSPRRVYLLQRKAGRPGATLGKTTGWVHRTALKTSRRGDARRRRLRAHRRPGLHITPRRGRKCWRWITSSSARGRSR